MYVLLATLAFPATLLVGESIAAERQLSASKVFHCCADDEGHPAVVTDLAITPDGQTIAAATDDHYVSLWNVASGQLRHRIDSHGDWVQSVSMSSDGAILATGAGDRTVCLWNLAENRRMFQLPACDNAIAAVCFHPNCRQLAVVGFCNSMQIVDIETEEAAERRACPCADLRCVAFAPGGERMAVAGRNGPLRIWNLAEGKGERDVDVDSRPIRTMAFSPDGRLLAVAGEGPMLRIFDTAIGTEISAFSIRPAKAFAIQFVGPQQLAVGGSDNTIRIWDLESSKVTHQLVGHTGTVAALAYDPNRHMLVSGSYDTTIRIWSLGNAEVPTTASAEQGTTR